MNFLHARPAREQQHFSMAYDNLMVFTGSANPKLAEEVVRHLNIHLGRASVGRATSGRSEHSGARVGQLPAPLPLRHHGGPFRAAERRCRQTGS